jgi:hypothetical protein
MCASLATSDCYYAAQEMCYRLSTALVALGKSREVLSKGLARTSGVEAAKASRLDQEDDCPTRTRKAVDAASKPAMARLRVGLTRGAPVAFAGRNQRDENVLALLLD